MTDIDAPLVFASKGWMLLLQQELGAFLVNAGVREHVLCEVYENLPEPLAREHGADRAAWTLRIRDGMIETALEECGDEEADYKLIGDHATLLPLGRMLLDDDNLAEYRTRMADAERAGTVRTMRGSATARPSYKVHNAIARRTA